MRSDIVVIIPAAGASTRLGTPKQEVIIGGQSLWQRQVSTVARLGYSVVLATGTWQANSGLLPETVTTVSVDQPHRGMAYSIRCAITEAMSPTYGFLILLIDQYRLTLTSLKHFIDQWDRDTIQLSRCHQYIGPPTLFPIRYTPQLLALDGESGTKQLALSQPHCFVDYTECALDIDTPTDLIAAQQHFQSGDCQ